MKEFTVVFPYELFNSFHFSEETKQENNPSHQINLCIIFLNENVVVVLFLILLFLFFWGGG